MALSQARSSGLTRRHLGPACLGCHSLIDLHLCCLLSCGASLRGERLSPELVDHAWPFGTNFHVDGLRTPLGLVCCLTVCPEGPCPAFENSASMWPK
jgi:hypothetical protein